MEIMQSAMSLRQALRVPGGAVDFGGRARQPPDVVQEALHRAQQVNEIRERQRIELQPLQPLGWTRRRGGTSVTARGGAEAPGVIRTGSGS